MQNKFCTYFRYCILLILRYIYFKNVYDSSYNTDVTDENDFTCSLATQFVMNEGADQIYIETYFN